MKARLLPVVIFVLIYSCSGNLKQNTVFSDGFEDMQSKVLLMSDASTHAWCYDPELGVCGDWTVATTLRYEDFDMAWQTGVHEGQVVLNQTFSNLDAYNKPLSLVTHPLIVTGDSLWTDCTIELDFTPLAKFDKCGLVFAYQHPNEYFFFGTEGNTVTLKHVNQSVTPLRPLEKILANQPLVWTPGEELNALLTIRRNSITAILNDSVRLRVEGADLRAGKVGLISDMPARFSRFEVKMLEGELRKLNRRKRQLEKSQALHLSDHPEPAKWKVLSMEGVASCQNLRLGDLTGDGNKELLFAAAGQGSPSRLSVSAMNLDGELLWQNGSLPDDCNCENGDMAVQVHDLDGDGKREVLLVHEGWIHILDGQTGKQMSRTILPVLEEATTMVFADLLGTGRDNCMLLCDGERSFIVLNEKLEMLWTAELDAASHPLIYDSDADGKDEIYIGYSAFNPGGGLLFDVGTYIGDQCNGISLTEIIDGEDAEPCLVYAAGDWGLMYVDFEGRLLKQNIMGHVAYISVADFDLESPGLELVSSNGWGSDGLLYLCNASADPLYFKLPATGTSRCLPVNWKGDGEEFFLLSADTLKGGMYDFKGDLSVRFPSDGHPQLCHMVLDLTGDVRDEIIVWDEEELWIYTQEDNPRMGNTFHPERMSLYNYSKHQMGLSLPGW